MKELKVGRRAKVLNNALGVPVGTTGKITTSNSSGILLDSCPHKSFISQELEIASYTVKDIQEEISCLEKEITCQQSKLQYMTENGLEEFDENQYKVFQTLKTLDNKEITQVQKSKIIAELINNKSL